MIGILGLIGAGNSYNGLSFGKGTPYHVTGIDEGLSGLPPVRVSDQERDSDHGAYRGRDLLSSRVFTLSFGIRGANNTDLYDRIGDFRAAFQTQETADLPLLIFGGERMILCRPTRPASIYDASRKPFDAEAHVEFVAADPRVYSSVLHTATVGLRSGGGLLIPATMPAVFSPSSGGRVSVANAGDFPTPLSFRVAGPVSVPTVAVGGRSLTVARTLSAGDTLVFDGVARTARLNGALVSTTLDSRWPSLGRGETASVAFTAAASSSTAAVTVQWRDAWA